MKEVISGPEESMQQISQAQIKKVERGIMAWKAEQKKSGHWRKLQAQLRELCDERGSKKSLCKELGLRASALSTILNDPNRQPCADMALALKDWADKKLAK